MESNAALAASLGISLTLAVTGLTLLACGLAIRGAGAARIMSSARYGTSDEPDEVNRYIGLRVIALGAGALAAASVSFLWGFLAIPALGLFGLAGSLVVALIIAGPKSAIPFGTPLDSLARGPREPSTPADWAAEPERRRADLPGQGA
jgi:hypothetical protein